MLRYYGFESRFRHHIGSRLIRGLMLVGAATPNAKGTDYGALDRSAGPLTCRRSFHGDKEFAGSHGVPPSFAASNAAIDYAAGVINYVSVMSFKPDVTMLATGALDTAILAFLASIPAGHKMILSIWHEADGKARATNPPFTVTQWKAAFIRFCTLVHQTNNPNLYTALILEAYQPATNGTKYADMWPGKGFADILLVDGYKDLGTEGSIWDKAIVFAAMVGIPWGVGEIGIRGGATVSTEWMAENFGYVLNNDGRILCWFDTTTGGVLATPGTDPMALNTAQTLSLANYESPNLFVL
jgi:hypothetical protein